MGNIKIKVRSLLESFSDDKSNMWKIKFKNGETSKQFHSPKSKQQVEDWAEEIYGEKPSEIWSESEIDMLENKIKDHFQEAPEAEPAVKPKVKPLVNPDKAPTRRSRPFKKPPHIQPGTEPGPKSSNKNEQGY